MFCELQCTHREHAVESCGTKDQPGDQRQTPSFLRNGCERPTIHGHYCVVVIQIVPKTFLIRLLAEGKKNLVSWNKETSNNPLRDWTKQYPSPKLWAFQICAVYCLQTLSRTLPSLSAQGTQSGILIPCLPD